MTWFEDSYARYEKASSDRTVIDAGAEKIFGLVWKEITEVVKSANEKGLRLQTGGDARARFVTMTIPGHLPFEPQPSYRTLNISLSRNLRTISATSDGGDTILQVTVCPDNVICVTHEGNEVIPREAARLILEPFLFSGQSPFSALAVLEGD